MLVTPLYRSSGMHTYSIDYLLAVHLAVLQLHDGSNSCAMHIVWDDSNLDYNISTLVLLISLLSGYQ